jgi:hypothetical protein
MHNRPVAGQEIVGELTTEELNSLIQLFKEAQIVTYSSPTGKLPASIEYDWVGREQYNKAQEILALVLK